MYTLDLKIELIKYIINREYDIDDDYTKHSVILTLVDDVLRELVETVDDIENSIDEYE